MVSFQEDIQRVINCHSAEAPSGTPDYILAEFLTSTLQAFNEAIGKRAEWRSEPIDPPFMMGNSDGTEGTSSARGS